MAFLSSNRFLFPLLALFAFAPFAPVTASAQVPTPAEVASTDVAYQLPRPHQEIDLTASAARRVRGRRLRIAGGTLMACSAFVLGSAMLATWADGGGGRGGYAIMGGVVGGITAPVFLAGAAVATSGYLVEVQERRRTSVTAYGAGVRLHF
jgi:hypothetical protein